MRMKMQTIPRILLAGVGVRMRAGRHIFAN
jgi:hypothetical protein